MILSFPWNIILLFAGAMSIGYCLWETGAVKWMAVNWLFFLQSSPPIVFILGMAFFVIMMTNVIMDVAAIAYNSKQFTTAEFFLWGLSASVILMLVTWLAVAVIWPIQGMEIYVPKMM